MKTVEIVCPIRKKRVSTGVRVTEAASWIGKTLMFRCPRCGTLHSWTPTQSMIDEQTPKDPREPLYLD